MTTPKATNKDAVEGSPSVINHCAPVMLYKPDENDAKPKPMVWPIPKIVATMAVTSTMWPRLPSKDLPNNGVRVERMVKGKPRE